jgi:hypothetical protein
MVIMAALSGAATQCVGEGKEKRAACKKIGRLKLRTARVSAGKGLSDR